MFSIVVRQRRGAALHLLILGILFFSSPINLSPFADLEIKAQSLEELALLEDLAAWVEPESDRFSVRDAIRERRQSFEVFRRFHGEQTRSILLEDLPFGSTIERTARRYGVDSLLLASIVQVESGFDPAAVSHRGATGLMQLMPATAGTENLDELHDPEFNLDFGARYLQYLLQRYEGDLELALAAYNAGPANVKRYGGVPPFRETRHYVEKVLEVYVDHHRDIWRESESAERLAMM